MTPRKGTQAGEPQGKRARIAEKSPAQGSPPQAEAAGGVVVAAEEKAVVASSSAGPPTPPPGLGERSQAVEKDCNRVYQWLKYRSDTKRSRKATTTTKPEAAAEALNLWKSLTPTQKCQFIQKFDNSPDLTWVAQFESDVFQCKDEIDRTQTGWMTRGQIFRCLGLECEVSGMGEEEKSSLIEKVLKDLEEENCYQGQKEINTTVPMMSKWFVSINMPSENVETKSQRDEMMWRPTCSMEALKSASASSSSGLNIVLAPKASLKEAIKKVKHQIKRVDKIIEQQKECTWILDGYQKKEPLVWSPLLHNLEEARQEVVQFKQACEELSKVDITNMNEDQIKEKEEKVKEAMTNIQLHQDVWSRFQERMKTTRKGSSKTKGK